MTNDIFASGDGTRDSAKRGGRGRRLAWTALGALPAALLIAIQITIPALADSSPATECGADASYIKYQIDDDGDVDPNYESNLPGQVVTLTRVGTSGNTYSYNNTTDDDADDSNDLEIFRIVEKAGNNPDQVTEDPAQSGTIETASNISHITFCLRDAPDPSPSPSPSETPTESPTPSPSPSETPTESPTPSPSPSETPTESPTPSPSPSETPTESPTPSPTPSETPTESPTPSPSPTETPTESPSPEPTLTPTPTPEPTVEATTEVLPRRIEKKSTVKGKVLSATGSDLGSFLLAGMVLLMLGFAIVSAAEKDRSPV